VSGGFPPAVLRPFLPCRAWWHDLTAAFPDNYPGAAQAVAQKARPPSRKDIEPVGRRGSSRSVKVVASGGTAVPSGSSRVGFEPDGTEVVPCGQMHVSVEGGGQAAQQGDGGFGAAFFDALDLIGGHDGPLGQVGDAEAQGAALVTPHTSSTP